MNNFPSVQNCQKVCFYVLLELFLDETILHLYLLFKKEMSEVEGQRQVERKKDKIKSK